MKHIQIGRKLYWKQTVGTFVVEFNGIPFQPMATRKMDCQFGDHYFQCREKKSKWLCTKSTRKIGCTAQITIIEYWVYPEYQISSADLKVSHLRIAKKEKHQQLTQAIQDRSQIQKEKRYYVLLPTKAAHNGMHLTRKAAGMTQRIDPIVSKYIEEIVRDGTTDVDTVQKF